MAVKVDTERSVKLREAYTFGLVIVGGMGGDEMAFTINSQLVKRKRASVGGGFGAYGFKLDE
ncbi:MAG: hypothetical protein AAF125_14080, partial [Chloroflexota bacterium]